MYRTRRQRKQENREKLFTAIFVLLMVAGLAFIVMNGSICTGDYEGDANATCIKIINR
jgi:hypothetical protein